MKGLWRHMAILLVAFPCFGQQLRNVQFTSINQQLSQHTVTAIVQDKYGFLWIGTTSGLNKYDGWNMVTYEHQEDGRAGLQSGHISTIYEDSEGLLWIGTFGGGLHQYDAQNDVFISYQHDEQDIGSLSDNSVSAIFEDHLQNLWIGTTDGGLNMLAKGSEKFIHYIQNKDDPFSISNNYITGIVEGRGGTLWIGTWGGGLNLLDTRSSRFIHYLNEPDHESSLSSNIIRSMMHDSNGNVWVATQDGLNRVSYGASGKYNIDRVKINNEIKGKKFNVVLSILKDSQGRLWAGTENGGITVLDKNLESLSHFTYDSGTDYGLSSNSIWSLYEDRTGIIWIGTFNQGLQKIDMNNRKFTHHRQNPFNPNSLSHNSVSSFAEDANNNIWIGTDGGGLNYWDPEKNIYTHCDNLSHPGPGLLSDAVLSLLIDRKDALWVGTWHGGISILPKGKKHFEEFVLDPVADHKNGKGNIFSMIEDREARIWICAFRDGLFMYDTQSKEVKKFSHDPGDGASISSNLVSTVLEDDKGILWVGTQGGGLNKYVENGDKSFFEKYFYDARDSTSLSSDVVTSLSLDSHNRLWVGTSSGLNLMDQEKGSFRRFTKKEGLPNEVICGMLEDDNGKLWISSNKGLSQMDLETYHVNTYNVSDGLQSTEFFKQSFFRRSNGELLFGGINGFNSFSPSDIRTNEFAPPVYFKDFRISNKSVQLGKDSPLGESLFTTREINLDYDQNNFSFEFSVISFYQTERNQYAYQLVNYDDDWQEIGNRRNANYTNVPAGSYEFIVKATNSDGQWSDKTASVYINIFPAWYDTRLAYILYITVIVMALVWAFRTIVNRERLKTRLEMEHMELSKMQELNEMKSRFFANISHEFRSPLTLILGPLKSMYEGNFTGDYKEQFAVMIRNGESLLNQINQLLDLSQLESENMKLEASLQDIVEFVRSIAHSFSSLANDKYIHYRVELPHHPINVYFERDKLERVVFNLLSNAFKYTPEFGKVIISAHRDGQKAVITVQDSGVGIPADEVEHIFNRYYRVNDTKIKTKKGTGIGLSLTKELVELHKGEIKLHSIEGNGTTFRVYLPLGKEHLSPSDITTQPGDTGSRQYNGVEWHYPQPKETEPGITGEPAGPMESLPVILVVEDNKDINNYVRQVLEPTYRVLQASNGQEGLELAVENIPDLIISDIMMPEMDGYEMCKKVKSDVKTSHIPIILLTAKASGKSTLEGFEIGADYYITKPFDPKLVVLRVRNILKSRDQFKDSLLNKENLDIDPKRVKIASRDKSFLKNAVEIVEKNMSNSDFYVDDLSKELGLSRMQLYRKLKGLIGQSANEFIRSVRLKRAAQLIEQDQLTISEITYEVGFNDLQYFRDCFKKQFGINPSEYPQGKKRVENG